MAHPDDVESVLGAGKHVRRATNHELYYHHDAFWVRFDFAAADDRCEFIEFTDPRRFPPTLDGRQISGPSLRQAVELVVELGYQPDEGALEDLRAGRLGQDDSWGSDSVDFPSIGLSTWTSLSTETDEGDDLGEHVLDTVALWRHGYWPDYP